MKILMTILILGVLVPQTLGQTHGGTGKTRGQLFGQHGFNSGYGGQYGQGSGHFGQGQGQFGHLGGGGYSSSQCRYWCRTPEGQAYCCEGAHEPPKSHYSTQVVKPGFCPPIRAVCPLRNFSGPPETCAHDGACFGTDKCCFDRCLAEHVCKQPSHFGRK